MSLSIRDQSQVQGFSAWSELNNFVYRKLSSWDAFFKWYHNRAKWNFFTVLAPAANMTNRLRPVSHFFTAHSLRQTMISLMWIHNTFYLTTSSSTMMVTKNRTLASQSWIMKAMENYKQLSRCSTDSFYQSFSTLFANHLKLHSRRYMFLQKRRSFEYRHCRCLARIAIALNRCSVYGQIQYTKPPEHLCLLNKLLQLVLVRVLTWSCYMIGVILIFQGLCQ